MSDIPNEFDYLAELKIVNSLHGVAREKAIQDFVNKLTPILEKTALRETKQYVRHNQAEYLADIKQVVYLCLLEIIEKDRKDPGCVSSSPRAFESILAGEVRNNVRSFVTKYVQNVPAGHISASRRRYYLRVVSDGLAQKLGRHPTAEEAVEAANKKYAGRKDAKRQGMFFTEADFAPAAHDVSLDDDAAVQNLAARSPLALSDQGSDPARDNGTQLASVDWQEVVASAIRLCENDSKICGQIAEAWLGSYLVSGEWDEVPHAQICQATGVSQSSVEKYFPRVKTIFLQEFERKRGPR